VNLDSHNGAVSNDAATMLRTDTMGGKAVDP
jgi:hypothetical protein